MPLRSRLAALGPVALLLVQAGCAPTARTHLPPFSPGRLAGIQPPPTAFATAGPSLWIATAQTVAAFPAGATWRDPGVGGLAVTAQGDVYEAVPRENRVYVHRRGGVRQPFAGTGTALLPVGDGGPALGAQLNGPTGLAWDPGMRTLYVADPGNHRVRAIDASGRIATVAGTGQEGESSGGKATEALLTSPTALAWQAGRLAISDPGQERVFVLHDGQLDLVAGSGAAGFAGDGGEGRRSSLSGPQGVAFDPAGDLFVADARNGRVRAIAPDGGIATVAADLGAPTALAASGSDLVTSDARTGTVWELVPPASTPSATPHS